MENEELLGGGDREMWKENMYIPCEVTESLHREEAFGRTFVGMAVCSKCQRKTACCVLK